MVATLKRLWRLYHTPTGKKMFRYATVSVISTIVSFSVLGIVFGVFRLWSEVPSTVFANLVASVPAYYLNRTWVWGKGGRSHLVKEILPFWTITIIGVVFAGWFVSLGGSYASDHRIVGLSRAVLLLFANLLAFAILWVGKYILFNKVLFVVAHHDHLPHTHEEHTEAGLAGAAGAPEL